MRLRLTLLLAASAFAAALLGVTQAGEASTQGRGGYRVTVSGTVTSSWTLGWTQQAAGCTTRGNGSGTESIRFQGAPSTQLDVTVRGRRVWIQRYISGPLAGSVTRQGDFTLARSGPQCSETRVAPRDGCGTTVDFSGTTGSTGYYFGGRGGGVLIFRADAYARGLAPETRTCVSSRVPDGGASENCCQIDNRGAGRLSDPRVPLRPKGSNKNRFRLSGRGSYQFPLRLYQPSMKAGTITVRYEWSALFVRAGRSPGR